MSLVAKDIKVSVIVPAYNVEAYIADCLDSLLRQTLDEIEIIVINDASTDSTAEIIQHYVEQNSEKIIFINSEENVGLGYTRNKGMAVATGKYIGFIDSDDWASDDMFQTLYEEAERGYDVVVCNFVRTTSPDSQNKHVVKAYWHDSPRTKHEFISMVHRSCSACNKLFSRTLIESLTFRFPSGWSEDIGFVPAVLTFAKRLSYVDNDMSFYRYNSDSITSKQNSDIRTIEIVNQLQRTFDLCAPEYKNVFLYSLVNRVLQEMADANVSNFKWLFYRFLKSLHPLHNEVLYKYRMQKNPKYQAFLKTDLMPSTLHVLDIGTNKADINSYRAQLDKLGYDLDVKIWTEKNFDFSDVEVVNNAYQLGNFNFVNDYVKLAILYKHGGICIDHYMQINLGLANLLWETTVIGCVGAKNIHTHVMASKPYRRPIIDLMATYVHPIYANRFLSLEERIIDYIWVVSGHRVSGIKEYISSLSITIEPATKFLARLDLASNYTFLDEAHENYEYYQQVAMKELLSYKEANKRLLENLHKARQKVNELEKSTSWRITKPLRNMINAIRKLRMR